MKPPIFVIGSPRSGTTLLRLMLTSHKNIVIPPECGFAVWFYNKYGDWEESDIHARLSAFLDDLLGARKFELWKLNRVDLHKFIQHRRPDSYPQLVSCVYEWYGLAQGRTFTRWGDKNNFHVHHIPTIRAMFPTAFFVHIARDGRDVACSYKKLAEQQFDTVYAPRLPHQIEDIAQQWQENIQAITSSFDRIGWQDVCEVRFEDLIDSTESTLRNLCDRLGEEFARSMLEYYVWNRERELEPAETLLWKRKNLEPPISAEVGRYNDELTGEEVDVFQRIARQELMRYGYVGREP